MFDSSDRLYLYGFDIDNASIPEDDYIKELPVVKLAKNIEFSKNITFFVGENGVGKSTLIEAVAVALGCNAEGGSKNTSYSTEATHSSLYRYMTLKRGIKKPKDMFFLRAESLYTMASYIDREDREPSFDPPMIDAYGGKSLHLQSHGESVLSIFENRFFGNGLYILDEPEIALSPSRQLSVLYLMIELARGGSQFIVATHSPFLITAPDSEIFEIKSGGIQKKKYDETELFMTTKDFISSPERTLKYLLENK